MVVISRQLFYEKCGLATKCCDICHYWTKNCWLANYQMFVITLKGVCKFYFPVYLRLAVCYLKSQSYGTAYGTLLIASICALSRLFGRIYYNFSLAVGFISGASIFLETPENRNVNSLIWISLAIEAIFNNAHNFDYLNLTMTKQLLTFMVVNSLLMHLMANKTKYKIPLNIWFYQLQRSEIREKNCCHSGKQSMIENCLKYCCKGTGRYFLLGYALNFARKTLGPITNIDKISKLPLVLVRGAFNKDNLKFGLLFGSYVGICRLVSCILFKNGFRNYNEAIAGFLAGAAFCIKPNINILSIALTTLLQILAKNFIPTPEILEGFPFLEFLYMISNGILFHNRLLAYKTCPKYYLNTLEYVSGGFVKNVHTNLMHKYLGVVE